MLLSNNKIIPYTLLALGVLTLSGCASQAEQHTSVPHSQYSSELNQFLGNAAPGAATTLAQSPWGPNVQVLANAPYFAASGRTCRELEVSQPSGATAYHLACQTDAGTWAQVRPVTRLLNP